MSVARPTGPRGLEAPRVSRPESGPSTTAAGVTGTGRGAAGASLEPPGGRPAAGRARSFGAVAAAYHRARSTYSPEALDWALEPAGPGPLDVLDLAAGTGLLTAALVAHRPRERLVAVEPDDGMRAEFVRHAAGAKVLAGTAEAIPLGDAAVDAVLVGTAFHWFDPDRALPEIGRVLRDGGVLAALWTGPDESVDWVHECRTAARSAIAADPATNAPARETRFAGFGDGGLFDGCEDRTFRHTEIRRVDELVAAAATYSEVIVASDSGRAAALAVTEQRLRARLAAAGPADPGRPGTLEVPVAVRVVRARRRRRD